MGSLQEMALKKLLFQDHNNEILKRLLLHTVDFNKLTEYTTCTDKRSGGTRRTTCIVLAKRRGSRVLGSMGRGRGGEPKDWPVTLFVYSSACCFNVSSTVWTLSQCVEYSGCRYTNTPAHSL